MNLQGKMKTVNVFVTSLRYFDVKWCVKSCYMAIVKLPASIVAIRVLVQLFFQNRLCFSENYIVRFNSIPSKVVEVYTKCHFARWTYFILPTQFSSIVLVQELTSATVSRKAKDTNMNLAQFVKFYHKHVLLPYMFRLSSQFVFALVHQYRCL